MLGAAGLVCAAVSAVVVFFPPDGSVGVPLHDLVDRLLGPAAFMLPLGLAFVGGIGLIRASRPAVVLPMRRLVGLGMLAVAMLPAEHLLASGSEATGVVGLRLADLLVGLFGVAVTAVLLAIALVVGTLLAFDVTPPRLRKETHAAS